MNLGPSDFGISSVTLSYLPIVSIIKTLNILTQSCAIDFSQILLRLKVNWCTNKIRVKYPSINTCQDNSVGKAWCCNKRATEGPWFKVQSLLQVTFSMNLFYSNTSYLSLNTCQDRSIGKVWHSNIKATKTLGSQVQSLLEVTFCWIYFGLIQFSQCCQNDLF